jgi:hypothetical protein
MTPNTSPEPSADEWPVPLSRFTSRVGGGSAFYVRRHHAHRDHEPPDVPVGLPADLREPGPDVASYFDVVEADRIQLEDELTGYELDGQRVVTTVQLIKALGGGWQADNGMMANSVPPSRQRWRVENW